jgi:hypothetical protein
MPEGEAGRDCRLGSAAFVLMMMTVRGKADAGSFLVVASRFLFPAPGRDAVTTRRSAPSLQLPRQTAQDTCLMHSDARILQSPSRLVARKQES